MRINNMKKLAIILLSIMVSTATWAVKAYPLPVVVTQSDGTQLTVIAHGDEDLHWFSTTDGVLLSRVGKSFYVATVNNEGELTATRQLAHELAQRSNDELKLIQLQDKAKFLATADTQRRKAQMKREPVNQTEKDKGKHLLSHTGAPHVLVILAQYSDTTKVAFPDLDENGKQKYDEEGNKLYTFETYSATFMDSNPREIFNEYLNGTSHPLEAIGNDRYSGTLARNLGSVASYFSDMSFGQFTPQFDVYGPVTLPEKMRTYGSGKSDQMSKFIPAVCKAAEEQLEGFDFANYDADDDGYVDLIYVIYAGYSASYAQNAEECIWPKSGNQSYTTKSGKKISRYGVNNELNAYPGASKTIPYYINGIGLFCHEFSHCIGLPDFYPTKSASQGNNQALEDWSLMDGGEYVDNGYSPTAYTAWEREAMGWMEIETLTEPAENIEMATIDKGGKAYRIMNDADATGNEYYILQNIQQKSWNMEQHGHGLLVFHVNYDIDQFSLTSNSVNNVKGQPRMTIVPADGCLFTSYNINYTTVFTSDYRNELAGDPFPGSHNVTMLSDDSGLPNFAPYKAEKTSESGVNLLNKALTNIREENNIITFDFITDYEDYVTGVKEVMNVSGNNDSRIYTLDGVLVGANKDELPKGIYIIGKKKVVVK